MIDTPTAPCNWAGDAIPNFIAWVESSDFSRKYSPNTIRSMKSALNRFALFIDTTDTENPSEVNLAMIRQFKRRVIESGLSESTFNLNLSMIDFFFDYFINTGEIQRNPVDEYKLSEKGRKRHGGRKKKRLLPVVGLADQDELVHLEFQRDHVNHARNAAIIGLLLDSGIRVSELCNLTIRDGRRLTEELTLQVIGKGDKERRVKPMMNYQQFWMTWIQLRIDSGHPTDPLFVTTKNEAMTQPVVYRLVNLALARAGVESDQSGPHLMRHSAASRMLNEGRNLREVQELLGHSSITVTELYLHLL